MGFGAVSIFNSPVAPPPVKTIVRANQGFFYGLWGINLYNNNPSMEISANEMLMGNAFARTGILINEPLTINQPASMVNNNKIWSAFTGISNMNRDNVEISENIVTINPPNANWAGIRVQNVNSNLLECNEVTGTSNASFAAQFGIRGDVNTSTDYSCNDLNMLGRGFQMTGPQPTTRLLVNHMTNTNVGVAIDQNGIIGPQGIDNVNLGPPFGTISFPYDNCWNSGITFHTRTFGATSNALTTMPTDGINSPFWLRPGTTSDCWNLGGTGGSFVAQANDVSNGDIATPVNNVTKTPLLSLWDCSQFPCTSGVGAPPFPFNTGMALRIAGDSVEYSNDSLDYRWWARKSLYRSLALHDTVLGQDSVLRNFFDDYEKNEALVQFDNLRLRMSDFLHGKPKESYNTLSSDIDAVTTDGLQEENMKDYLLSYLQFHFGDEPDTAIAHIWTIATQCVFKGGPSVLEARSFLTLDSLELINYEWNDSCGSGGGGSKMDNNSIIEKPENAQKVPTKAFDYKLIPNLFKDNKTAMIIIGENEQGFVEIYNVTGSSVRTYKILEGNNTLYLNELPRGVFIYKVLVNGEFKNNDKLVILE